MVPTYWTLLVRVRARVVVRLVGIVGKTSCAFGVATMIIDIFVSWSSGACSWNSFAMVSWWTVCCSGKMTLEHIARALVFSVVVQS